jgi:hypothetical protein
LTRILLQKGLITTSDLGSGGKLNPVQSNKFIDYVVDETSLVQACRVVRFRNEEMDIDKIAVNQRVAMPAAEARDPGLRRSVSTSKVTLHPKEVMIPFELSTNFLEHNIEGMSVEERIVRMMARQGANDVEELGILGNELGPARLESDLIENGSDSLYVKDSFLALGDGFLKQAEDGHVFDAGGAAVSANIFSSLFQELPTKFRRNRSNLRYLVPSDIEQQYRERLSSRATAMGDMTLTSTGQLVVFGTPVVPVNLLPRNPRLVEHVTFTGSGSTVSLGVTDIQSGSAVVTATSLSSVPNAGYTVTTDYTIDYSAGTITHAGGGSAIGNTETVKVTYLSSPKIILTTYQNMIMAIGRDISIETDRDIFARLNQWAISLKVDFLFEEVDAVAMAINLSSQL